MARHPTISQTIQQLQTDISPPIKYIWKSNVLRYKDHLVLSPYSTLKPQILNELHSSTLAGHSGFQKTYARACCSFFWEGMKNNILTFVTKCDVCQCHKGDTVKTPGALQLLPIPASIWTDISMEFIVGLLKPGNKSVIMVVVNRLSKYAHFCALPHPFTPALFA
jgi:hypothetical protein